MDGFGMDVGLGLGLGMEDDDDLGNLVSQLNDLNSFFTATADAVPEPISISPAPPPAPATFQNEAERRVAAILSRSLARRGDSISSMDGVHHGADHDRSSDKAPGTPYIGLFEMSTPHRSGAVPDVSSRANGQGDGAGLSARGYFDDSDGEAEYEGESYNSNSQSQPQSHGHSYIHEELSASYLSPVPDTPLPRTDSSTSHAHGHGSYSDESDDGEAEGVKDAFGLESPRQRPTVRRLSSGGLRSLFGHGGPGSGAGARNGNVDTRATAAFGGTVNMNMSAGSRQAQKYDRRRRI
ncbi:hypothetical protein FRC09_012728 [Ceratobasidium sp. 395]|nr:hypothetical protein FRC09_012728 [Ceratobasidium sp. 395]